MNFVVFDFETTGLSPERDEILEIGAVRWKNGQIEDTYHALVRPGEPISQMVTSITGLADADFESAAALEDVLPSFLAFIAGWPLAGHNVSFDLDFLMKACDNLGYELPTSVDALDSLQLARVLLPTLNEYTLKHVAQTCSIQGERFHRALEDAVTTAHLIHSLYKRACTLPFVTLQDLARMAGMFSATTSNWFQLAAEQRHKEFGIELPDHCDSIHQLVFSTDSDARTTEQSSGTLNDIRAEDEVKPSIPSQSIDLLDSNSNLKNILPGFEVREGQKQMVKAVVGAFEEDQHLLVEAGTGTGKSLAYLIPAALYAKKFDTRVVVSTHTIALQDQIEKRDFPTLQRLLGESLSLTLLKGRIHYVCMRKLHYEVQNTSFASPRDEVIAYMSLLVWLISTLAGMREELSLSGKGSEVWSRVQSESETCINKRCPFFKACYYFRARGQAYEADVIVTNHSLVFSDIKADYRVLPRYEKLVLDEAHHLEDEATKHLGEEVHLGQCLGLINRLSRDHGKHGVIPELIRKHSEEGTAPFQMIEQLQELDEFLGELRGYVDAAFQALGHLLGTGQSEFRITNAVLGHPAWESYLDGRNKLFYASEFLNKLRPSLDEWAEQESDSEKSGRLYDASGFLAELIGQVSVLCQANDFSDEWVVWIERTGSARKPHLSLHRAPIDVARILEDLLFSKKSTVVLTSATMSVNGSFDYTVKQLGLGRAKRDGQLVSLSVTSPFRLQEQALLCVPTDVPELAKMEAAVAATWLSDSLYQLAKASSGRLLALFTSHAMLRATAEELRQPLAFLNLRLYAQGLDGSRSRLLEAFKNDPQSVLLGAQSFWEGIDLPGDELTTLVIVRLPFAPPTHPVTEARHERLERQGRNPFMESSLPEAVVKFRQGFGRLIRTVHDRGVVVVYDKRLITARYGQTFIRSLAGVKPFIAPEQQVLTRVREFLQPDNH